MYDCCKQNIDQFMNNLHGIGVFMGILSSLLTCPKIAKIIFQNYWKKLCIILRYLLKSVNKNGAILYGAMETKKDWPFVWTFIEEQLKLQFKLNNIISISGCLSSHIYRMDAFFTRKHWKYFVKCKLFELLCNATYFEYCSARLQNSDAVRINYHGQTIDNCCYMRWFHTAYGMNVKLKNIFKNKHIKSLQNLMSHPRMIPPFVPNESTLRLISLGDKFYLHRKLQHAQYNGSHNYWKEYKQSKECHSPKCNKIQFYYKLISFRKCGNCCLVVYCSKKCQKYDWSRGNHKEQCEVLKQIKQLL
eukprot:510386_1